MHRSDVEIWLEGYTTAWASDNPADIAALFTGDATYSPFPWPREEGDWQGRDEIVEKWIERGDSKIGWRFEHQVVAVEGPVAVVEGRTEYDRGEGEPWAEAYANIFVIEFAEDGRARSFREWWVERPTS